MSAERLREAAALMRERAEAVNGAEWYKANPSIVFALRENSGTRTPHEDADYIASWHPAVAHAVADWLDRAANDHDETPCPAVDAALAVANAYLGDQGVS